MDTACPPGRGGGAARHVSLSLTKLPFDDGPLGGVRPFHQKSTCLTQLNLIKEKKNREEEEEGSHKEEEEGTRIVLDGNGVPGGEGLGCASACLRPRCPWYLLVFYCYLS